MDIFVNLSLPAVPYGATHSPFGGGLAIPGWKESEKPLDKSTLIQAPVLEILKISGK